MVPPLSCRPMRCRRSTPHQPSPLGLNSGTAVNRQKIWRRPSVSAYLQTGARWLLGRGLPPVHLPSPVMHAASPMNGPTPRRTMTTWNIVRGVGVALASPNDNCACGDARMHQFAACRPDRKLSAPVNRGNWDATPYAGLRSSVYHVTGLIIRLATCCIALLKGACNGEWCGGKGSPPHPPGDVELTNFLMTYPVSPGVRQAAYHLEQNCQRPTPRAREPRHAAP